MNVNYLAILLLLLHPPDVGAELYEAYYQRRGGENTELKGMYHSDVTVASLWQCSITCMVNRYCMSFNFGPKEGLLEHFDCVHNMDVADASGKSLTPRPGFRYYEQSGKEALSAGVTAAAFDPVLEDLWLTYMGYLLLFPDLTMVPRITYTKAFNLNPYRITGLLIRPGGTANQALFRAYLDNGSVIDITLNTVTPSLSVTPATDIKTFHGAMAPQYVDDVIKVGQVIYLIFNDVVYVTDGTDQVTTSYHIRDGRPSNPFVGAPLQLTACARALSNTSYFFKGVRYYLYDLTLKTVVHGGLLIDETA